MEGVGALRGLQLSDRATVVLRMDNASFRSFKRWTRSYRLLALPFIRLPRRRGKYHSYALRFEYRLLCFPTSHAARSNKLVPAV